MSNIRTVRSFANEEFEEKRYIDRLKHHLSLLRNRDANIALFSGIGRILIDFL